VRIYIFFLFIFIAFYELFFLQKPVILHRLNNKGKSLYVKFTIFRQIGSINSCIVVMKSEQRKCNLDFNRTENLDQKWLFEDINIWLGNLIPYYYQDSWFHFKLFQSMNAITQGFQYLFWISICVIQLGVCVPNLGPKQFTILLLGKTQNSQRWDVK